MNTFSDPVCRAGNIPQVYSTVLLLDNSPSMEDQDWPPSRLHGACDEINGLTKLRAQQYPDDYLGVVGFSENAEMLHPLVRAGANEALLKLDAAHIATGSGTNISAGLMLAGSILFNSAPAVRDTQGGACEGKARAADRFRQIILLTDGEHNEGEPEPTLCAQLLKRSGIWIEVIGIGTPSDLDETCLRNVASRNPDGTVCYTFIGERHALTSKMRELAHHYIRPM